MEINLNILNPNLVGELLRSLTFTNKGFGGYNNFDLQYGFSRFDLNKNNVLFSEYRYEFSCLYESLPYYSFTNGKWQVIWQCDGDGILIFQIGDNYYINTDSKKSYGWEKFIIDN